MQTVALFGVGLVLRLQVVGIGPLLPRIQESLEISHDVAGLLATIPVLSMGVFAPPCRARCSSSAARSRSASGSPSPDLDLGFSAINSMELREVAEPHLRDLSDGTGFTVNMAVLDDLDIVYVERCRSGQSRQREIDLNLHVGARLPAYCTSLGKVLLAWLPPDQLRARRARITFTRRGPNTLTSRTAFAAELKKIRSDGFAINNEELAYGLRLRSIAAPVLAHDGTAAAAINLAVHSTMLTLNDLVSRLSPALLRTSDEISARLGYRVH